LVITMNAAPGRSVPTSSLRPIPPGSQQEKSDANYLFVSNIRFLSMAAVVLVHCIGVSFSLAGISNVGWLARSMRQPVEFDVIGFFLISGFLLEEGLTRRRPSEYLLRRFQRIFLPWLAWFSLYCGMILANDAVDGKLRLDSIRGLILPVCSVVRTGMLSPYWFVPNLFFALGIFIACRRFLFDLRMGCFLLAMSLFCGVNLYAHWIPAADHSQALFGFIFYLWLGAWTARNFAAIHAWLERTSMLPMVALAVLAGAAALVESSVLAAAGNPKPMNILRISNQIYSIAVVLVLARLRKPIWPHALNVRTTTFGIYLSHTIAIWLLAPVIKRMISTSVAGLTEGAHVATALLLTLGSFAITYGGSLALTQWLLGRPRLCWLVGYRARESA
jgi:fucose 4-O-acetylase-like acetyltransferase